MNGFYIKIKGCIKVREDILLVEKLGILLKSLENVGDMSGERTFAVALSSKYSGGIAITPNIEMEAVVCSISLYRRSSGLAAHEIVVTQPIGDLDGVRTYRSSPYSRGVFLMYKSVGVLQRGKIQSSDLDRCVQAIQRHEEKLAYIKLLEKFGI